MDRVKIIDVILYQARRPRPEIVAGIHGGFVFLGENGTTYSPRFFKTPEEARVWLVTARAEDEAGFKARLQEMSDEQLTSQQIYWGGRS